MFVCNNGYECFLHYLVKGFGIMLWVLFNNTKPSTVKCSPKKNVTACSGGIKYSDPLREFIENKKYSSECPVYIKTTR